MAQEVVFDALETDVLHGRYIFALLGQNQTRHDYQIYNDYYDGTPEQLLKYFKKRHRETVERYADRPKIPIPLCRTVVDMHAEALVKENVLLIDDPATQEEWNGMAEHNALDAFDIKIARMIGKYGACGVKPLLHNDGTRMKVIEWEAHPPTSMQFVYEDTARGRSVKRVMGALIQSGYNVRSGAVLDMKSVAEARVAGDEDVQLRTELLTKKNWIVWLDNAVTPISPITGDIWMPTMNGINPFGVVPVALFNGIETDGQFLGMSDIHHGVYDNQVISEIWSDTLYMHRMYVPIPVLKSANEDTLTAFKLGIGAGFGMDQGDEFLFANAEIDWKSVLEPMRVALELFYSNSRSPAVAVGLGHLFGDQQRVSGKAKEFEWKPTVSHANEKRPSFARGKKDLARISLTIASTPMPFGQGKKVNPEAHMRVEFKGEITPTSKAEELDRVTREILAGLTSVYKGMIEYRHLTPEEAAEEVDRMIAWQRRTLVDIGYKHIEEAIAKRQKIEISSQKIDEAIDTLYAKSAGPIPADELSGEDGAAAPTKDSSVFAGLNGAQITAAMEILNNLSVGAIDQNQAKALMEAMGVSPDRVERIVKKSTKRIEKVTSGVGGG